MLVAIVLFVSPNERTHLKWENRGSIMRQELSFFDVKNEIEALVSLSLITTQNAHLLVGLEFVN